VASYSWHLALKQEGEKTERNEPFKHSLRQDMCDLASGIKIQNSKMHRGKRVKQNDWESEKTEKVISRVRSNMHKKHESDSKSGGIEVLLPSLIGIIVLGCAIVAKMGWRGRSAVAGIDLGTTNSVICVQQQSKGVGKIQCIPDPFNGSPIIPSVVSITDPHHSKWNVQNNKKGSIGENLFPPTSMVTVGAAAKARIDSHPHHTFYHAKRVLGHSYYDDAVVELMKEVEFGIVPNGTEIAFRVPFHTDDKDGSSSDSIFIAPHRVGSYVVNHLISITQSFLGHENVKSAVIAVPAKFEAKQIQETVQAFRDAGVSVARILEEPVAAALAYGLQKKENVDFILVYDFGGGTLDVSILQVSNGFVDVIGNDGDNQLGGADFDAAVAQLLLYDNDNRGLNIVNRVTESLSNIESTVGRDSEEDMEEILSTRCTRLQDAPLCSISSLHTLAEKMKIKLSSSDAEIVYEMCLGLPMSGSLPSDVSSFCEALEPVRFSVNSEAFESSCALLFDRALVPIERLLEDLDMTAKDIDEVVMVGGTTKMPNIRKIVQNKMLVDSLNTSIDPDLTVAYGAASVID
jgi:molecular chaperone DnaK (HSP70)